MHVVDTSLVGGGLTGPVFANAKQHVVNQSCKNSSKGKKGVPKEIGSKGGTIYSFRKGKSTVTSNRGTGLQQPIKVRL